MSDTSTLRLRIFDGSRELFSAPAKFLITIVDGNQTQQVRDFFASNDITFTGLPFFDNFGDNYTVVVFVDGYKQAGFTPVKLSKQFVKTLDIMLVANDSGFSFADATWPKAKAAFPFLGSDAVNNAVGMKRYDDLLDKTPKSLACLLNFGGGDESDCAVAGDAADLSETAAMGWDVCSGAGSFFCVVGGGAD